MRRMRTIFLLLVAVALSTEINAAAPETRKISLEESIKIALEHNLDVQIERINPEISRYNLSFAYAGWDPVLTASGQHDFSLSPGGLDPQNRPFLGSETDANTFRAGLSGLLPFGLNYNLSGNLTDSYGTRPDLTQILSPDGTTNFLSNRFPFENTVGQAGVIVLRQPLLKNFWIDSTRANIAVNKKRLKISELGLSQQIMNTVTSVELAYYDLVFAQENVKVQEKALQLADQLLRENKKRVEVGALAPLDEKQAESQAAARRADLLSANRLLAAQQNVLKNLLSDKYTDWQAVSLEPAEALSAPPPLLNLQDSWQKGLSQRPDLLQARVDLERQQIVLRYDHNQLFPQLDLIGSYGHLASGREFSDALGQIKEGSNPYYSYGAAITIPLSNRAARQTYKISKAEQRQLLLRLKKLEQSVMVDIEDAVKLAQTNFERVDATKQARLYAEAALEAEQKKLENGKSTSFNVLFLQRDLTLARSSEIQALTEYNRALSQLSLKEGTTIERNRLKVEIR